MKNVTSCRIANMLGVLVFFFWIAETSVFLYTQGWHWQATTRHEIFCDKIVSYGFLAWVVINGWAAQSLFKAGEAFERQLSLAKITNTFRKAINDRHFKIINQQRDIIKDQRTGLQTYLNRINLLTNRETILSDISIRWKQKHDTVKEATALMVRLHEVEAELADDAIEEYQQAEVYYRQQIEALTASNKALKAQLKAEAARVNVLIAQRPAKSKKDGSGRKN